MTVSILLGLAMILNIIRNDGNYNVLMASALVVSLWGSPLAVVVIALLVLILIRQILKQTV